VITLAKWSLGVLLLGSLVAILAANFRRDPDFALFKWKLNHEAPVEVKLDPARRGRIVRTVEAPGKIEADTEVKISAQVMGRIVKLGDKKEITRTGDTEYAKDATLKEGDTIKEGEKVVELDKVQYQADVGSAEARVKRLESAIADAEANLDKSQRDVARTRPLFLNNSVTSTEMADMETLLKKDKARLAMAKAELIEARAALVKIKEDLLRTTIRSPINGIVSQLMAKEGEVVVIGTMNNAGTVIMSISDFDTRVVRARIDENNIALVKEGQKVVIHLQNDDTLALTGTVERISPKGVKPGGAQAAAGTNDNDAAIFETIIRIDSPPPQVRLGMNANVEIQVDERSNALVVPTQAVLHRQARELPPELRQQLEDHYLKVPGVKDPSRRYHQVVFINDNGVARCRLVKIGISDESRVEIVSGLEESESVIVGPYRVFEKLKDGALIKELIEQDEVKTAGSPINLEVD
jgi:HlyD family secretion protein